MGRIIEKFSNFTKLTNLPTLRLSFFPGFLILGVLLSSCAAYKQNIMFRVSDPKALKQQALQTEANSNIQKDDLLQLDVYTNHGERIIDPNLESFKQQAAQSNVSAAPIHYLVDRAGVVKFPMVGEIKIEGLTLKQAEQILQKEYTRFYEDPFVILKFANKRVIVLGSPGGLVIPLANEHMTLVEVLALAKGVGTDGKAHNIRVLRGNEIYLVDFSTIEGYMKNNLVLQSGDVVYVEPVRRPFTEGLRELIPIVSIITSLGTLAIVIIQLNK